MVHRAILGSYERFLALIIEHFAGAFPVWLSPLQAVVLPISEKHFDYAKTVRNQLRESNIRSIIFGSDNETLGKKIRDAEMQKIPYLLIVGDKEVEAETVTIRKRGEKKQGVSKIEEFIGKIKKEIGLKK